jgi:hypothetical protein
MKKVLLAFAAICCIALVSSFSLPPDSDEAEDYTFYYLMEQPVCDVPVSAYNCAARAPLDIVICPGTGVSCVVKVTFLGATITMNNEKGRDRANVEISGSAN